MCTTHIWEMYCTQQNVFAPTNFASRSVFDAFLLSLDMSFVFEYVHPGDRKIRELNTGQHMCAYQDAADTCTCQRVCICQLRHETHKSVAINSRVNHCQEGGASQLYSWQYNTMENNTTRADEEFGMLSGIHQFRTNFYTRRRYSAR